MSRLKSPEPSKLVISLIVKNKSLVDKIAKILISTFGEIDIVSPWLTFDYTTYYEKEMGRPLFRRMLAFKKLTHQDILPEIKVKTDKLEQEFSSNGKRKINIDPGYLLRERFVLATGKNFAHRIYIGQGVYADLTLIYKDGRYHKLAWTYPDYADEKILTFLYRLRKKYTIDLKNLSDSTTSNV